MAIVQLNRGGLDVNIAKSNRRTTLNTLWTLSEKGDLALRETCILALGRLAQYVS